MATRATYSVGNTVFYCHYDGYPTGAAERFVNMVKHHVRADYRPDRYPMDELKGGLAFAFVRGNDDAEPAYDNSHEGHGDTEWRYMLAVDAKGEIGIQVTHRPNVMTDEWVLDFRGELLDWFRHATKTALLPGRTLGIVKVCDPELTHGRTIYLHASTARELGRIWAERGEALENVDRKNPNGPIYFKKAQMFAVAGH